MYTGHKDAKMPEGKSLVDWITPTVINECRLYGIAMPTPRQIAVVISAIRMHTIILHASEYDRSELGQPDKVTEFYPIESSIGRFFRDAARVTIDGDA